MLLRQKNGTDEEQWAPVSDLMAVTMLVFMLIAMILSSNFALKHQQYKSQCEATKTMLRKEFDNDFKKWGAELADDLTIRFTNKSVYFENELSKIKPEFKNILDNFFPRYMQIIQVVEEEFNEDKKGETLDEIIAVRIEGHTSSVWQNTRTRDAYVSNMQLSQNRSFAILEYVLQKLNTSHSDHKHLAQQLITASGLSSSKLICDSCKENQSASRRVEFKLLTRSCQKAGRYEKPEGVECPNNLFCAIKLNGQS